jgi:hypothetical protein
LRRGDDLTYRFQRAGVYPFVCTYHVGMVGAVVVGGAGPAMAASTGGAGSVLRVSTETTEEAVTDVRSVPVATSTLADPGALSTPWSAIGLAVVASLAAACVMLRHGRREREGA